MYYNNNTKDDFINDYDRSMVVVISSLSGLFNKISTYENHFNKDCSCFNKEEILYAYKDFNAKSVNVLLNYNVYLKSYTSLQIYNGKANINYYETIKKENLIPCIDLENRNKLFLTREQLDDIEDMLFNYTDKAIMECLWQGISGKDMRDIISLERNMLLSDGPAIIFKDGHKQYITEKLYDYIDKAFNETEYICYGETMKVKKMNGYGQLYKERDNVRGGLSNDKAFRWIYRKVQNYRDFIDLPMLTMKNIQASGLMELLKEGMKQTNLGIRAFLATEEGKNIATKYGYTSTSYVDVITNKFEEIIK